MIGSSISTGNIWGGDLGRRGGDIGSGVHSLVRFLAGAVGVDDVDDRGDGVCRSSSIWCAIARSSSSSIMNGVDADASEGWLLARLRSVDAERASDDVVVLAGVVVAELAPACVDGAVGAA